MKRLLAILLCSCGLAAGGEEYTIYFRHGTNTSAMVRHLAPLRIYRHFGANMLTIFRWFYIKFHDLLNQYK